MSFSKDFLWGSATSAFQYEGANRSDNKGWTTADQRCAQRAKVQADTTIASDGYNRTIEDVALMAELGLKSYRFSISWARIFPEGDGVLNQLGIDYYLNLIMELKKNNIEPIVTLMHFDIPWSLVQKYEGFVSREAISAFVLYAKTCFEHFGDHVNYWLTINEQNVMSMIPAMCGIAEDDKLVNQKLNQANYNMYIASAKVINLCHEKCPHAKIGPCVSYPTFYPYSHNPEDVAAAYDMQELFAFGPMDIYARGVIPKYVLNYWTEQDIMPVMLEDDEIILSKSKPDFIGLNWYCTQTIGIQSEGAIMNFGTSANVLKNDYLEYGDWGWSYDPKALRMALRQAYYRYEIPVMICENGWSSKDVVEDGRVHDSKRVEYLRDHFIQMDLAIQDGVDLIGYQGWSFVDILSSSDGFNKRYGLVYVDREEFDSKKCERIPKDSFYYYKEVIRSNGDNLFEPPLNQKP